MLYFARFVLADDVTNWACGFTGFAKLKSQGISRSSQAEVPVDRELMMKLRNDDVLSERIAASRAQRSVTVPQTEKEPSTCTTCFDAMVEKSRLP